MTGEELQEELFLKCRTFVYQTSANTWTFIKLKDYGKKAGFELVLLMIMKSLLGCGACSLVQVYRIFGRIYSLHLQVQRVSEANSKTETCNSASALFINGRGSLCTCSGYKG
jgi:hypothetical protein